MTPTVLVILSGLFAVACKKQTQECSKMGFEYTYFKPGVMYSPFSDSIALGENIILTASAPKTFFDEQEQYNVTLNHDKITGPFGILKATNDSTIPILGAIDQVELTPIIGTLVKDSLQFSQGQLKSFRTAYWSSISVDSFSLKVQVKPKTKGIYFLNLGQQGNRDKDCALFKYFLKIKNDQHLYLLSQANNGYIGDYERNYVYCFKVY